MRQITVLSLFDGISCARVALDRLGYTDVLYLASEVDKYASAITRHQWPDTIHLGDITKIKRENLPVQIDLLIGGSPCQDLSIAKNNRKGLDGERSGLFWEWVRLWKECEPRYWVLENVNSMPKEAKRIISETLCVEPIMINAALVSAQNRKRLFWTNIETDMFGNCHIPQPTDRGILLKHILESGQTIKENEKSLCIRANYKNEGGSQECLKRRYDKSFSQMVYDTPDKSHPINATYWKAGTSESDKPIRVGDIGSDAQGQRVYSQDGKSVTLSAMGGGQGAKTGLYAIPEARGVGVLEGYTIRKLTPIECERLMTLPDNYTALGDYGDGETKPVSNTQRYKTLGNGFVVEVVAHILSFMEES
jgi:DNA (cytosine-5)-methyltransferase 3A